MATTDTGHPLSDLLGGLVSDISMLFHKEIELAKTEASEKLDEAINAGRSLAIGAVLAIGAIGVFLAALVSGLAALLISLGMQASLANFIAAIVVTVVVAIVAWIFIARGSAALKANKLNMQRTTHSLQMGAAAVKESF
jgi:uncharacterized protein YacL